MVHINIPAEVYEAISEYLAQDGWHRSVTEFILECARSRLYKLRQQRTERIKLNIKLNKQRQPEAQAGLNNGKQ
ncbi:MAG: hypothetical protein ACRD4W_06875 [Nitrososphaeraceae archaeon]